MGKIELVKDFPGEEWREVRPDFEYCNPMQVYVSNFGRLKTHNRIAQGRLLKGSMLEGYKAFHFRYFKPRTEKDNDKILVLRNSLEEAKKAIRQIVKTRIIEKREPNEEELLAQKKLETLQKSYDKEMKANEKKRVIHITYLAHRLVAEFFTEKPSPEHNIAIHLDHDKLNNHFTNVRWCTQLEASAHQQFSPVVIAEKKTRKGKRITDSKAHKLNPTKVSIIKKRINEGVDLNKLAKQFKVTTTQIKRIKSGENWGDIPAAK